MMMRVVKGVRMRLLRDTLALLPKTMVRVTRLCILRTRTLMMWAMRLEMMDRREVTQMDNNMTTTRTSSCKIRISLNKMGGKVNLMEMR